MDEQLQPEKITFIAKLHTFYFELQTGRIEPNYPKVCGHQGNVLDIKWNPFIENIIASCSEDTSVSGDTWGWLRASWAQRNGQIVQKTGKNLSGVPFSSAYQRFFLAQSLSRKILSGGKKIRAWP